MMANMVQAQALIVKLRTELGRMNVDSAMGRATKTLISNYRWSLVMGKHIWTGRLWKNMYPKRLGRGMWTVIMPKYGEALDHMEPHFVGLKRGRKVRRWYRDKVLSGIAPKKYPRIMWVEPTHYMDYGNDKHPYNIAKEVEIETWKSIRRAIGA